MVHFARKETAGACEALASPGWKHPSCVLGPIPRGHPRARPGICAPLCWGQLFLPAPPTSASQTLGRDDFCKHQLKPCPTKFMKTKNGDFMSFSPTGKQLSEKTCQREAFKANKTYSLLWSLPHQLFYFLVYFFKKKKIPNVGTDLHTNRQKPGRAEPGHFNDQHHRDLEAVVTHAWETLSNRQVTRYTHTHTHGVIPACLL